MMRRYVVFGATAILISFWIYSRQQKVETLSPQMDKSVGQKNLDSQVMPTARLGEQAIVSEAQPTIRDFGDEKILEAFDEILSRWGGSMPPSLGGSPLDTPENLSAAAKFIAETRTRFVDARVTRSRLSALTLIAQSKVTEAPGVRDRILRAWEFAIREGQNPAQKAAVKSDYRFFVALTPTNELEALAGRYRRERTEVVRSVILRGAHAALQRSGLSDRAVEDRLVRLGFEPLKERAHE